MRGDGREEMGGIMNSKFEWMSRLVLIQIIDWLIMISLGEVLSNINTALQ
jgi:hypothetical protein